MTRRVKRSTYKIVLLGDPRVGKTSIRRRYLGKGFEKNYNVTLGADFAIKRLEGDVLQIWDLAGQPVYKSVRSEYYKGAEGAILVFSIVENQSFMNIPKWLDEMIASSEKLIPIILVGNKSDLRSEDGDQVSPKDAKKYSTQLAGWSGFEVPYIESSALTGTNIDKIFNELIDEIEANRSTDIGY